MTAASDRIHRGDARWAQSLLREINDRVAELSHERDAAPPRFVCECPRVDCGATVVLSLDDYERARSDSTCFIVFPGHEDAAGLELVERRLHESPVSG